MVSAADKIVLVVDDEPDIVMYLATALEDAGFQVVTASDGQDALEKIAQQAPDFISMDLVMPRKSGIKLFHELRRNKQWAKIPCMVVTGHGRDETGSRDLEEILSDMTMSGPGHYLEKPVKAAEFVKAVASTLDVILDEEPVADSASLRREASDLLENADPATLAAALELLKSKK